MTKQRRYQPTFVYFARCGSFVKIGVSNNPRWRVWSFQGSNPYEIELIGMAKGDAKLERALHRRLEEFRHRYEWFRLTAEVEAVIAETCPPDWEKLQTFGMSEALKADELRKAFDRLRGINPDHSTHP